MRKMRLREIKLASELAAMKRKGKDRHPFLSGSDQHLKGSPMVDSHRGCDKKLKCKQLA